MLIKDVRVDLPGFFSRLRVGGYFNPEEAVQALKTAALGEGIVVEEEAVRDLVDQIVTGELKLFDDFKERLHEIEKPSPSTSKKRA
ncbi:MAG: hypothetical protein AAB652_00250 [Patescibacteria group bacterium]